MAVVKPRSADPAARLLIETFGTERGTTIEHEKIEATIKERRRTARFQSIVRRWTDLLHDMGIRLQSLRSIGYRIPEPGEQLSEGERGMDRGVRRVVREGRNIGALEPDSLNPEEQRRREHRLMFAATVGRSMLPEDSTDESRLKALRPPKE